MIKNEKLNIKKQIEATIILLNSEWTENSFRDFVIPFIFKKVNEKGKFLFTTDNLFSYCYQIIKERHNLKNWNTKIDLQTINSCDLPLQFTQQLLINQILFNEVVREANHQEIIFQDIIKFIETKNPKFFEQTPKTTSKNKIFFANGFQPSKLFIEFQSSITFDEIQKQSSKKGENASQILIRKIIDFALKCEEFNNNIKLAKDFETLQQQLLSKESFSSIAQPLILNKAHYNTEIARELFFSWKSPEGFHDKFKNIERIKDKTFLDDLSLDLTNYEKDIIPIIFENENEMKGKTAIFSDTIKQIFRDKIKQQDQ